MRIYHYGPPRPQGEKLGPFGKMPQKRSTNLAPSANHGMTRWALEFVHLHKNFMTLVGSPAPTTAINPQQAMRTLGDFMRSRFWTAADFRYNRGLGHVRNWEYGLMRQLRIWLMAVMACGVLAGPAAAQKKSIVIGIDGMGYGTRGLGVANTPWINSLINGTYAGGVYNGAYTNVAYAGGQIGQVTQQPTVSGPGWSTILTSVWANRHNVTDNNFTSPNYTSNPVYLGTLRAAQPALKTATFVNWDPIDTIILNSVQTDSNPANNLTFHGNYASDSATITGAVSALGNMVANYDAYFVALDDVDAAGHSCGSSGACYQTAIETADTRVGQMLTAISNRPNFASEDWQFIVTADHGHQALGGHGGQSDLERNIPFVVASKTLTQGHLVDAVKGVSHADVAPTVLAHFGVSAPAHYFGTSRGAGGILGNPDINGDGVVSGDGTGPYATDDVTAFVSHWLHTAPVSAPLPADLNIDGIVNLGDWGILNTANPPMGQAIFAALGQSTPEPAAWLLLLLGAVVGFAATHRQTGRYILWS